MGSLLTDFKHQIPVLNIPVTFEVNDILHTTVLKVTNIDKISNM